jgi:excisionase family DNA binding protein
MCADGCPASEVSPEILVLTRMAYEPLMNDVEAAEFLGGLHPKTVQRMARRGQLPAYRVGRYWRFKASELTSWLVVHSTGQKNPPAQPERR